MLKLCALSKTEDIEGGEGVGSVPQPEVPPLHLVLSQVTLI